MRAIFRTLFVGAVLAIGTGVVAAAPAADGKESTTTLTFKDDGRPYAVSGNPDFDMVSVKRVDAMTVPE